MDTVLLPADFYGRDTVTVARDLLGKQIVRIHDAKLVSGIISETEAYGSVDDQASHAYRGKTARNAALFGPIGHSYIYFIYGNHYCLNIVARSPDARAGGVLIRALMPHEGIEVMHQRRRTELMNRLTNGPGNVAQALQLTLQDNYVDMTQHGSLYVMEGIRLPNSYIKETARIGIRKAQDKLWRFIIMQRNNDIL
jgi:DNA-3-methyladenine glycosylase